MAGTMRKCKPANQYVKTDSYSANDLYRKLSYEEI